MLMNICSELQWRLLCCSNIFSFSQFSSSTQSCPALCDPVDCSTPGFPVHRQLPARAQIHVHRVVDAIKPSHPLSSPSPLIPSKHLILLSSPSPALNLSHHQGLFQWVSSLNQVAKVLEFQLQHQSFQWIFRTDFFRNFHLFYFFLIWKVGKQSKKLY